MKKFFVPPEIRVQAVEAEAVMLNILLLSENVPRPIRFIVTGPDFDGEYKAWKGGR